MVSPWFQDIVNILKLKVLLEENITDTRLKKLVRQFINEDITAKTLISSSYEKIFKNAPLVNTENGGVLLEGETVRNKYENKRSRMISDMSPYEDNIALDNGRERSKQPLKEPNYNIFPDEAQLYPRQHFNVTSKL